VIEGDWRQCPQVSARDSLGKTIKSHFRRKLKIAGIRSFITFIVAHATTYARHTPSLLVMCYSCLISIFIRVGFVSPGSCLVTLV